MTEFPMTKIRYDLEERTYVFAKDVHIFCKGFTTSTASAEYVQQVIRSSSSVGANYIEANESLGKKDFLMRARICLKESKETGYWLKLLLSTNIVPNKSEGLRLLQESIELKKIFAAIIVKSQ